MSIDSKLQQLLSSVFEGATEGLRGQVDADDYANRKHNFVFHLTDWRDDLDRLRAIMNHPEQYEEDEASSIIIGFLYHVTPHLNAAARLMLGEISDPFAERREDESR